MQLLLLSLALLLVTGLYYLWKLGRGDQCPDSGPGCARVVIVVKDQEPWVEGFFRKLFHRIRNVPRLEVQVVDGGSSDGTPAVLDLLSRDFPLEILPAVEVEDTEAVKIQAGTKEQTGVLYSDLRGLRGKALYNAPFFYRLSQLNAGKSRGLSK